MRQMFYFLFASILLCGTSFSQAGALPSPASAALNASDTGACSTAGACLTVTLGQADATANIVAAGTYVATAQIEAAVGNGQWAAISCPTFSAGAAVSSFTGNAGWQCDVAGKTQIRVRISAYTSGTLQAGIASSSARSTIGTIPVPQSLATSSTPTFAGVNQTVGNQFSGVTSKVFVASDFSTSGSGTNLEQITGLAWTLPASTALNVGFDCHGVYQQTVGQAAVTFGVQTSQAPTNLTAEGLVETAATTVGIGGKSAITTATSSGVVTGTPAAQTTDYAWHVSGFIENPSQAADAVTINVKTATAGDIVVIKRDSYCTLKY